MRRIALVAALLVIGGLSLGAQSERRHALVIGNGNYAELGRLKNPANDAQDMAAALRELGFEVKLLVDADLVAMEEAVERLGGELARSPDSTGFFFYAGHGVQSGGINFLIPADARIVSESYLKTKALAAQAVLETLQRAKNALNVVVLDACRDNPFSWGRSGGARGLSVIGSQPPGSIVVYATSAGSVAQDGTGRNGVFTAELLNLIRRPGLDINEIFKLTGRAVNQATAGKQVPAVYNQFFEEAYLAGGSGSSGAGLAPAQAQAQPALPPTAPSSYAPPSSATAELVVSVDREGAEIWADGKKLGTAPNLFSGLPAGREILVEARQGPYSASERITLKPGETREMGFRLELGRGNLFFHAPSAASYRLWLDGSEQGPLSAAGLAKELGAGEHEAELRAEGLYWKGRVEVKVGATVTVKASPWEVGTVTLEFPADASFRLTPERLAAGAPSQAPLVSQGRGRYERLPAGSYSLEAWGPGYESYRGRVDLGKGEEKRIEPWTTGSLVVTSEPLGAEVSIGGQTKGQTPLTLRLIPGYIEVSVKREGYKAVSSQQLIIPGKTTQVAFIMKEGYEIGDRGPAGGIVFYDKGTYSDGWRHLEAAPTDQSSGIQWYNGKYLDIKTGTSVGTGEANTEAIIAAQGEGKYAAMLCNTLTINGFSDWFLPSKDELDLMYKNLKKAALGGFGSSWYWSSSQDKNNPSYSYGAWIQDFGYGGRNGSDELSGSAVRAVRVF